MNTTGLDTPGGSTSDGFLSWIGPVTAGAALTICLIGAGTGQLANGSLDMASIADRFASQASLEVTTTAALAVTASSGVVRSVQDSIEVGLDLRRHAVPLAWLEQLKSVETLDDMGFSLPWND